MILISKSGVSTAYEKAIHELEILVEKILRKPKVAFIGRSDVGKSTMINTLLRIARIPAYWTLATAIVVCIKHTNYRPAYMDDNVWVFQSDVATNETWDDAKFSSERSVLMHRIILTIYDCGIKMQYSLVGSEIQRFLANQRIRLSFIFRKWTWQLP